MKKIISLIKATMTDNMNIFKIKNTSGKKTILPFILAITCMFSVGSYANMIIESLTSTKSEYILLSLFTIVTFFLTLVEGVYKSSNLLFNCKDDNLLFSLPIKRRTVLFIRIFKFYVFELLYNSLFLFPAMIVYSINVRVGISYYIVSLFMLLLLPIIPIVISCLIGGIISSTSSKFKFKNMAQVIVTTLLLLVIFYFSFNMENILSNFSNNASHINSIITSLYYPANAYVKMVTDFKVIDLLLFIVINILIFIIGIYIMSIRYFKINSRVKEEKNDSKKKNYIVKVTSPKISLIRKELNRFFNTPVFIINAGFGLVLFIVGIIAICFKFDSLVSGIIVEGNISINEVNSYIPIILYGFVCFTSFMTSISSSMISLEGKSINILKSLPVKSTNIIMSKVVTSVLIMIPVILLGDIIMFIKFSFNIIEILMIIIGSILLPLVSETIGIIVNLKYPKMDAENDTEVVKQSMSSMISVFIGMALSFITIFVLVMLLNVGVSNILVLILSNLFYMFIFGLLLIYLNKCGSRDFNRINV